MLWTTYSSVQDGLRDVGLGVAAVFSTLMA